MNLEGAGHHSETHHAKGDHDDSFAGTGRHFVGDCAEGPFVDEPGCRPAQASTLSRISSDSRIAVIGFWPVAGRSSTPRKLPSVLYSGRMLMTLPHQDSAQNMVHCSDA